MNNYEFCADWVIRNAPRNARVLDYGCGAGQTIAILRARGIEAFGCDVFYGESTYDAHVPEELKRHILPMEGDRIPFANASFDVVISNMVLEHVPNLDVVASELRRVLKPSGLMLHIFPDASTWREGHCEIPFLHWFPKGSTLRVYYAALLRAMGIGAHKDERSALRWARDQCEWLDAWTHYRPLREITAALGGSIQHIEREWFAARFGRSVPFQEFVARKFGGVAIVMHQIGPNC